MYSNTLLTHHVCVHIYMVITLPQHQANHRLTPVTENVTVDRKLPHVPHSFPSLTQNLTQNLTLHYFTIQHYCGLLKLILKDTT